MIIKPVLTAAIAMTVVGSLASCKQDETLAGYGAGEKTWGLVSINGQAFEGPATLRFEEDGKISGTAPCNTFFAEQKSPYPWFELGPIGATRKMCPDMSSETAFFTALGEVTLLYFEVAADGEPSMIGKLPGIHRDMRGKTVRLEVIDLSATAWIAIDHVVQVQPIIVSSCLLHDP